VFPCQLLNAVLEAGALGDELLDRLAGDHLVEVAELAHQLPDALPLGEDLFLRPSIWGEESGFLIRCVTQAPAICSSARACSKVGICDRELLGERWPGDLKVPCRCVPADGISEG
jgi:hypothetical protein